MSITIACQFTPRLRAELPHIMSAVEHMSIGQRREYLARHIVIDVYNDGGVMMATAGLRELFFDRLTKQ